MSKQRTNFFIGIALLMMLLVHMDSTQVISIMEFCGKSVWSYFYPLNSPVPLFLILSGYGFYFVCQKPDNKYWYRVAKLFVHFWIILLLFVPLYITIHSLSFDVQSVVFNITGWYVSWNGTLWFVFPYVILALSYRYIYKLGKKIGLGKLCFFSLFLHLASGYIISRLSITYETSKPWVYNIGYLLFSLFPFVLGMSINKFALLRSDKSNFWTNWGGFLLIFVVAKILLKTTAFNSIYAALLLFVAQRSFDCRNIVLETLGKHSLNIWMMHAFLLPFFYIYKYDVLLVAALLLFCFLLSQVVDTIAKPIEYIIINRLQRYTII